MIRKIAHSILSGYYKPIDEFLKKPVEVQRQTLDYLIGHGRSTLFGQEKRFDKIRSHEDFKKQVPVSTYEDLRPYLDKIIRDKQKNVLWDTPVKWFAMSSGTTEDKSKYIPVTQESLFNCHYRCGYHMLAMYAVHNPATSILSGKSLVLGGSRQFNAIGGGFFTGDISAILIRNLPFWAKKSRTPESIALIPDWEDKLQKLADFALKSDIRSLVGVPSWMLVLLRKLVSDTGKPVTELLPNLEVFFHGGVSFIPFEEQYRKLIASDKMRYWETYNASEGFFGVQFAPSSKDMLLLLDNEIYYEFLPVSEWGKAKPEALSLCEIETGRQYAVVISTSGGLWRYMIGDTIEFTSANPYLFRVTGRTKQYINAFGEEIIADNADRALNEACRETGAKITEYTVAPIYFGESHNGAHEWLIEFEDPPPDGEKFVASLDENLKKINSDYEAKRSHDLSLSKPVLRIMPKNTFYDWMKSRGRTGGQNKVLRLSNDRKYVDSILDFIDGKY